MALGKGLSQIFGDQVDDILDQIKTEKVSSKPSTNVDINSIRVNPYQPRKHFDKQALEELSDSIKEHGIIQPLVVRKSMQGYELIAGERRLRASKIANLKTVPVHIVNFNDTQMMEVALLENIQRKDLTPIEEAQGYQSLIDKLNYTQDNLSKRVSKSRSYIANSLRLLKLPPVVQDMLNQSVISIGHARALINIEDDKKIIELANMIIKNNLTVRDIERLSKKSKTTIKQTKKDIFLENVRRTIESKLQTKSQVTKKSITIYYDSTDDLNRILEKINCLEEE